MSKPHVFPAVSVLLQAMPTLIELMKDPSVVVRDTTAWTVGRICELLPEAAINEIYLAPLLQCLIEGLGAEPRVASNVCWVSAGGRAVGVEEVCVRVLVSPDVTMETLFAETCLSACLSLRPSRLWLRRRMKPRMLQRIRRSRARTVCPRPSRSSCRNSWRPQTGDERETGGLMGNEVKLQAVV